jgi:hypothetical protein
MCIQMYVMNIVASVEEQNEGGHNAGSMCGPDSGLTSSRHRLGINWASPYRDLP